MRGSFPLVLMCIYIYARLYTPPPLPPLAGAVTVPGPARGTRRRKGSNLKSGGSGARRNDTVAMVTAEADGPATLPKTTDAPVSSRPAAAAAFVMFRTLALAAYGSLAAGLVARRGLIILRAPEIVKNAR